MHDDMIVFVFVKKERAELNGELISEYAPSKTIASAAFEQPARLLRDQNASDSPGYNMPHGTVRLTKTESQIVARLQGG